MLNAAQVWRDFVVDGVPSSGEKRPDKSEIRALLKSYEAIMGASSSGAGSIAKATRAQLDSDLAHDADIMAWVYADPNEDFNGIYRKSGASGSGSWSIMLPLPYSFIRAANVGGGSENAILATTDVPVSEASLIIVNVTDDNAGPVTISFNDGSPLPVKSNTGNDISPGGIIDGMLLLGVVSGGVFRIVNDQVSAAIVAQAEAILADFQTYYLGSAAADPLTPPAQKGTFYFNTTVDGYRYWDGSAWQNFPLNNVADGSITFEKLAPSLAYSPYQNVASAATTNIGGAASGSVTITGNATISSFGASTSGLVRRVRLAADLRIQHSAALWLPFGGADVKGKAGDTFDAICVGPGNWIVNDYQRAAPKLPCAPWIGGTHFGRDWADVRAYRDQVRERALKLPKASGAKVVTPGTFPGTNSNAFGDVTRMADGESYFLSPSSSTTARIFRSTTKTFLMPNGTYAGSTAHNGSALLNSGRIIMAPYSSALLLAFNPYTESLQTLQSGIGGGANKYAGVVIAKNDLAVFVPHTADQVGVWSENSGAWALGTGAVPMDYAYVGGIPLPDGKVLMVPHMATRAGIFDPDANALTFGAAIFPGAESFFGGSLIDDTRAILFPHKNDRPVIYDFINDTVANFPVATGVSGIANFAGGVALADGRFFMVPFQSAGARIIDLTNNSAATPPGSYGSGAFHGGALMDDGNVIMAPFNSPDAVIAQTGNGFSIDPEYTGSPHINYM